MRRVRLALRLLAIQRTLIKHGLEEFVWATHLFRPVGWLRRLIPGVPDIIGGVRRSSAADSRAALTVWAVVVPQSLAYASLAGVPSVHGLYAAMAALVAYAVFGTCRDLNMGAESTVAIMAAATVAPFVTSANDVVDLPRKQSVVDGYENGVGKRGGED